MYEDALLCQASDKMLAIHSDAQYLDDQNTINCTGGHFYLSDDIKFLFNNGAIVNNTQVIEVVMSLAAETEIGALYINVRKVVYMRQILAERCNLQKQKPIQTDDSMVDGIINHKVQPKCTNAMDMHFYWLSDWEAWEQFRFFCWLCVLNFVDIG